MYFMAYVGIAFLAMVITAFYMEVDWDSNQDIAGSGILVVFVGLVWPVFAFVFGFAFLGGFILVAVRLYREWRVARST